MSLHSSEPRSTVVIEVFEACSEHGYGQRATGQAGGTPQEGGGAPPAGARASGVAGGCAGTPPG